METETEAGLQSSAGCRMLTSSGDSGGRVCSLCDALNRFETALAEARKLTVQALADLDAQYPEAAMRTLQQARQYANEARDAEAEL